MSFLNFFKRKKKEEKLEKIKLKDLERWILNKKEEVENKKNIVSNLINDKIIQLTQELEKEIETLEKIDLKETKVEEKIKFIVRENLSSYIKYLKELMINLKNLEEEKFDDLIEKIDSTFFNFNKKSSMNFQKATFLIGKELDKVRKSLNYFLKSTDSITKKNKDLIDLSKTIDSVENNLKEINEIQKFEYGIEDNIKELEQKINYLENKTKKIKEEIDNIKQTKEYLEEKEKEEEIWRKREELKKRISELREIIDFKFLANVFHSDKKKMDIIKEYKENFLENFLVNLQNKKTKIIDLLKEAKAKNEEKVLNKIKEIAEKEQEINKSSFKKNKNKEIKNLDFEIKNTESKIEELNHKIIKEKKKYEKIKNEKNMLIMLIKDELLKIGAELEIDKQFSLNPKNKNLIETRNIKILLFTSPTCLHCPQAENVVKKVAPYYKDRLQFEKIRIRTDKGKQLSIEFNVMSTPTILILVNGIEKKRIIGAPSENNFKNMIEKEFLS